MAFDWGATDGTQLRLDVWLNDTSAASGVATTTQKGSKYQSAAPGNSRAAAAVNLASNTYMRLVTVRTTHARVSDSSHTQSYFSALNSCL